MRKDKGILYTKDFDRWNISKKVLDGRVQDPDFYILEGEIWWTSIGINVGHEIDGKNNNFERPVLVMRVFPTDLAWVLPITTSSMNICEYVHNISNCKVTGSISLLQLRSISSHRFLKLAGRINDEELAVIRHKIAALSIKSNPPI